MTEKRYFKRMWEDEYYIFDSNTISEKEFDEKVEYEDYQAFADSLMGDEVVDRLNELAGENQHLKSLKWNQDCINEISIGMQQRQLLEKENEQLKQQLNYIQNSISEHIKHQKTELSQKALKEIIEDYNEWLLGHNELVE